MTSNNISELEAKLNYTFSDKSLLEKALLHSSYINESDDENIESNERLEFLGDSIIGVSVADNLYKKLTDYGEGALTALKSRLVNTESLSDIARSLSVGDFLVLGKGADKQGERNNNSLLENAFEAIVGAIYLDGGYVATKGVLDEIFENRMNDQILLIENGKSYYDYKTALQIELQKNGIADIKYEIIEETGPDHDKTFKVAVQYEGKKLGEGMGKTKKVAEQMAAKNALEEIKCI